MGIKWLVPQCARLEAWVVGGIGTGEVRGIAWERITCMLHGMYELTRYCVMDKAGHEPDTDDHSVISLPFIHLHIMKPLALLAKV